MIRFLTGTVKDRLLQYITLDVQGIGFGVFVADEQEFTQGQSITLVIYFAWSQEHGPQLYGFTTAAAYQVFCSIISCPGIGPKIGLALLNKLSPQEVVTAVITANTKVLSSVSGVGAKKAEVISMHLKDKITKLEHIQALGTENTHTQAGALKDVAQTLTSLGYARTEIAAALDYTRQQVQANGTSSFEELLRKALLFLSKRSS